MTDRYPPHIVPAAAACLVLLCKRPALGHSKQRLAAQLGLEGTPGQRLNDLDRRLRAQGQHRLLFIGSDCPALLPSDYHAVSELLDSHDTVLLKARDGGVVLMASNRPWPDLRDLPWSTAHLAQTLADKCRAAGHSLLQTGDYFDIDHRDDLQLLALALAQDARPARLRLRDAVRDLGVPAHA